MELGVGVRLRVRVKVSGRVCVRVRALHSIL